MQIELRHLHDKIGMTTVYVTHDQREALTMSDRIAVINHGRVMQLDDPVGIYEKPANRFVADFIGESTFLPVTRDGDRLLYSGTPLHISEKVPDAPSLYLLLRPERIRIVDPSAGEGMNTFQGIVQDVVYQGDSFLLYATLPDGIEVSLRGVVRGNAVAKLPAAGDPVTLGVHADDTVIISGEEG